MFKEIYYCHDNTLDNTCVINMMNKYVNNFVDKQN